ncbi:protocadherin Fat 4-like [Hyla sarda]|uniref:protocadherin Fat 4-like n=1 Tax=Hyla sarda TaxID=327740 RepID=UPI0024C2ED10|nr:protocadherin Fat 4-like [Hyla sarda]
MKMLRQLLQYLLLHFVTLNLLTQGNPTTSDVDDMKYDAIYNDGAIRTPRPPNTYKPKIPSMKGEPENGPKFVQDSYRATILETCELNAAILNVEAKDTHTSLIKYSLSGPGSDYFHINPLNGVITLAKVLEYNSINRFNLDAYAEDSKGFSSSAPVIIDIQDVDTMNPHFIFPLYEGLISENKKGILSTHPEEIKAVDGDLGINETVYYSITKVYPPEFRNVLSIDQFNGTISLNNEIDRETVSHLIVEIKAVQQNSYFKSADSVVLITILDENDNMPEFSQAIYEADIPENSPSGSKILVLSASDNDQDGLSNGYFHSNNTMFTVDKNGVMYFIHGNLDRELTPRIHVQVWVFDAASGGRNSSAEVIINITDVNDNNPQFHNLPLHYTVPEGDYTENTPLLVATLNVSDLDTGLNGNVTITVNAEDGDQSFKVQNGNIFAYGPLDREVKDKYVLFLVASDKGSPPRQSFADAVIVVEDVNDNAPTFTKEEYSAELVLNKVKAGATIVSVSATDQDFGNNSLISYRFVQPHSGFSINEENGDIILTSDVSADTMKTNVVLPVIATDHGAPAWSSTATVIIKVSEGQTEFVNSTYNFSLLEGMPEGSDVGSVEVTSGPDVSIMYFVQTYPDLFSITEKGTIITRAMLDREEQDTYNILVTAVDSQDPPNTAAAVVTIIVMDVNDNLPVFSPLMNSNITCLENKNFQDLANIVAIDLDIGNNSAITYSLENDFNSTFNINSVTGKLMNIKPLDADKRNSYDLKVIAKDSGIPPQTSTALIHVTVQDVDDNRPVFKRNIYNITVKENEPPHVILNVSAVDLDFGPSTSLLYSFIEVSDLFYIGEESGFISNLKPLDFEEKTEHVLTVTARSFGNPHPESTATVIVHVENVNEEGPTVEHPTYHMVIWDGEFATGSIILDINANKGNKGMDEGIHYSISGNNSEELFSIANGTGHIFLTKDLPIHSSPEYYALTVTCTDSGAPPQSTSVKVFVVMSPSNITVPVFSSDYYIPESLNNWTVPNTYLIQIKAFYLRSSLIYSIEDERNEDYFVLDSMSGIMRTKKLLKIEDFPCNVTVKATDSQKPWIYSEAMVHVTVTSDNHYAPVFTNSLKKVTVKEEQTVPTFVAQVQATDQDAGRDGIVTYSILNSHSTLFSIDDTNGKVVAAKPFDFENGTHEFQVFICAEDDGMPHKKQDYLTLIVQVLDVNDYKPEFSPHEPMYVKESAPAGTVVGQITATDGDSGDNAFIVYSLLDGNDQFSIDRLLGNIFVKSPLDHEMKEMSMLTVTARNNKTAPFYQSTTNVTVFILDENDNPPQFMQKTYFTELDVNSPVGSYVIALNATDKDEGNNGVVEYSLLTDMSPTSFLFENVRDGKIITATNHLEPGKVNLSVIARDRGSPSLSVMASVIVNLVNLKKPSPAFSPNEVSTVLRNNKPEDEPVFTFSAKNTTGQNVMYRIVAGNDKGHFYLDEKTGKLWTTKEFNKDVQSFYNLTVEVDTQPNTQGPLPPNRAQLQITVQNAKEGPVFEKEIYVSTIANTVPPGYPVIKVKARSRDSMRKPIFFYKLVNDLGGEFHIDNHTGQIVVANVAGKTATFQLKVKVTDENGLSAQTLVQIQVESPSSSSDISEIKINQTSEDVKLHMKKILRALEEVLQNKITNISLNSDSSNKQDTEIKFKVAGESNQEIDRKLKDNLPTIQKQLGLIFGKPTDISIPQPHNFALFNKVIEAVGGVASVVILAAAIAAAAFFLTRKRSKRSSSELSDKTNSAGGSDMGSNNIVKKQNGDKKPDINGDQCGVPPLSGTQSEKDEHIAGEEKKRKKKQHFDADHNDTSKLSGTPSENEKLEAISEEENKSTDKEDEESTEKKMDETVADTPEQTEENTLPDEDWKTSQNRSKRSRNELLDKFFSASGGDTSSSNIVKEENGQKKPNIDADQYDVSKLSETESKNEKHEDTSKEENKSTDKEDEESTEKKMDETVADTPEQTEENTLPDEDCTNEGDKEPPEQHMDQTVADTQEQTEQNTLPNKDWKTSQNRSKRSNNELLDKFFSAHGGDMGSSNILNKGNGTEKADKESPEQQMVQTVTDTQEQTEQDTLPDKDSTEKADKESPEQQMLQTVTDTQEQTEQDTLPDKDSTAPTDEEILDVEISETVTYTVEPSDENSESEQSVHEVVTITEEEIIKKKDGEEIKITEEKQIELVETWESYESTEGSETDPTKNDEIKEEIPESTDDVVIIQANEQSDDNEKMTCAGKIVDGE